MYLSFERYFKKISLLGFSTRLYLNRPAQLHKTFSLEISAIEDGQRKSKVISMLGSASDLRLCALQFAYMLFIYAKQVFHETTHLCVHVVHNNII